ncbi:outer membrane beta-barrel protein [Aquimarina algicola]|uniref:Outer membrane protein beta-barrel domain-containing protein n=1 Tax=Aquimarina algicola TaxID=2589995 RepID=A0A504JMG4_9FLAO|nr:outer membrane beta-barrel protein [Aquimarina algicola]TPN87949.1 hypothetical protein FHK87_10270 [Aquimarina algicola]
MSTKKNIDRLFQEKFKDFEATPREAVWEKIKAQQENKNKKRIIPIWWYRAAGVAAIIAILFGISYSSFDNTPKNQIVITQPETNSTKINTEKVTESTTESNPNSLKKKEENIDAHQSKHQDILDPITNTKSSSITQNSNKNPKGESSISNPKKQNLASDVENASYKQNVKQPKNYIASTKKTDTSYTNKGVSSTNTIADNTNKKINTEDKNTSLAHSNNQNNSSDTSEKIAQHDHTAPQKDVSDEKNTLEENSVKKSIFDAIAEKEEEIDPEEEVSDTKKWNITPSVGPVYYDAIGNESVIDNRLDGLNKDGQVNMSYGVQVSYAISNRISVRSGVSRVDLGYNTEDVNFDPTFLSAQALENIDYNNDGAIDVPSPSTREPATNTFLEDTNGVSAVFEERVGSLNQSITYIEVPLEMKYALVNKRFGVNMIGGISTLFLQNNDVTLETGEFSSTFGESNNLNDVSFTGNVGLGIDYQLSDVFGIALEPIFKYQFNAFSNNNSNFRPYYFGVYTGISIKF